MSKVRPTREGRVSENQRFAYTRLQFHTVKEAASVTINASKTLPKKHPERVRKKAPMRTLKGIPFLTLFLPVGLLGDLTLDEVDFETEGKNMMVKITEKSNENIIL